MLLGVGIDILSLTRLSSLLHRRTSPRSLARRICAPRELREFDALFPAFLATNRRSGAETMEEKDKNDKVLRFLSARWTLKEAAYKALPPYFHTRSSGRKIPLTWSSLDLSYAPSGQPILRYLPPRQAPGTANQDGHATATSTKTKTERLPNGTDLDIELMCSLSHDAGVVVGVVIAMKKG